MGGSGKTQLFDFSKKFFGIIKYIELELVFCRTEISGRRKHGHPITAQLPKLAASSFCQESSLNPKKNQKTTTVEDWNRLQVRTSLDLQHSDYHSEG